MRNLGCLRHPGDSKVLQALPKSFAVLVLFLGPRHRKAHYDDAVPHEDLPEIERNISCLPMCLWMTLKR